MSGVEPVFQLINAESGQRLEAVERAVLSLTVEESADSQSDSLSLRLDASRLSVLPKSGTAIEVRLGYRGKVMMRMGVFKVGERSLIGPPFTLSIRAQASDFSAPWKSKRTRHWDNTTVGDVLRAIADEHGLRHSIDADLGAEPLEYMAQTQESDMQLVVRMADRLGAYGTIKDGMVVLQPSMEPDEPIRLKLSDISRFEFRWEDKPAYDTIVASWADINSNISHTVVYDGTDWLGETHGVVFELPTRFTNEFAAKRALRAKWESLHRLKAHGRLTLPGRGDLISKRQIEVSGFYEALDDQRWEILRSRHSIGNDGYVTEVELRAVLEAVNLLPAPVPAVPASGSWRGRVS